MYPFASTGARVRPSFAFVSSSASASLSPAVPRLLLPLALAAIVPGTLRAQQADAADNIVVTGARVAQNVADTLPAVTVITRADIEASQSRDLVELLSRQTGLEMARSGGQGAQTSLFLRGTNSNQVLVLVDGVRVNTALAGAANLGGISTDDIERIEIARGNLSSLYGSEAIGGVIQIFTRGGAAPGAGVLAEAGQGHTRDASAHLTAPVADATLSVSAGYRTQKAISAIDVAQVPFVNPAPDGNWSRNGSLRLEQHGSLGDFSAWAWGNHNDTDFDDPFNSSASIPSTRATQVEHRTQDGYGLSGAHVFGASRVSLAVAETRDDAVDVSNIPDNDPANDTPYSDNDNDQFRSRNRQITLQDTTTISPGIDLLGGWEHLSQLGAYTAFNYLTSIETLTQAERQVDSFWAGTTGRAGSQQWQVNLRNDRYSDFGSATTGLLGWGWNFSQGWKLTAQASTAFRAPSFEELYYPQSGNPALQPERARSQEIGLRWGQGALSASASIFRNRISNLIVSGPPPGYVEANVGHASADGAELQGAGAWGGLRVGASLSVDRPRDLDTGLPLLRRAGYGAKLSAGYVRGPWSTDADVQRTGARDDIDYLSGAPVQLSPYTLARFALRYAITPKLRLDLRVENLLNTSYQLVDGYNTLPRLLIGGVEASW